MKKIIASLILLCFISNIAVADCDFSTGAKKTDHNTYEYTIDCHIAVGQMKQDLEVAKRQLTDLTQAITLKDLAITKSDQRAQLWMSTSADLESRLQKVDSLEKGNQWIFFGLGALTVLGAGFMASRLLHP